MAEQYRLPEEMRAELSMPMGRLFEPAQIEGGELQRDVKSAPMVVTVGDKATETIGRMRVPDVQIVDSRENRKPRAAPKVKFVSHFHAENPPGGISAEAIEKIGQAFAAKKPARVLVEGEEDLLAMPAIAIAPISSHVYYGQPGQGIVLVVANSAAKGRSFRIMQRMGVPESLLPPNS